MSKVSVTGSKDVLEPVVETVHDLDLVHLTEYGGNWPGFDQGSSAAGAESAADKLVTVRSLESILEVEPSDAGRERVVTDEALEEDLAEVQAAVNEVKDREDELRDELRDVTEKIEAVEPLVDLGIRLDLLSGYRELQVAVGRGDEASVRERVASSDSFGEFELFTGDGTIAVFARPTTEDASLSDRLVGAEFAGVEVPTVEQELAPATYIAQLADRRDQLEDELAGVEAEYDRLREEWGGFLLAAEEELSIRVGKAEAPLSFATTENAFVAEGWLPADRYTELEGALVDAVGDRVEVEKLQTATFGHGSDGEVSEELPPSVAEPDVASESEAETPPKAVADGGPSRADSGTTGSTDSRGDARTDGGTATSGASIVMRDDEPPTVQNNPSISNPFELLTNQVGTPNYREFDPTIIVFLTFPLMFGFMVGDVGYGIIYTALGGLIYSRYDSDTFQAIAGITVTAGLFTTLFGLLYGEIFGTHLISRFFWEGPIGLSHPPIEKGLSPATREWAKTWFVVSVLFGIVHLNVGYVFEFIENFQLHGVVEALEETGSWMLVMNGLYLFVFSGFPAGGDGGIINGEPRQTPAILFETFSEMGGEPAVNLGFTGFEPIVGVVGIAMVLVGFVLLGLGPTYELTEFVKPLSHSLSYLRVGAVLIAKAGLAFAVNLFAFGVYVTGEGSEAEWHFGLPEMKAVGDSYHGKEEAVTDVLFGGLLHGDPLSIVLGVVVLLVGNLVVLILGVTSSGIQALRLEYFEFFEKFYEGQGREYDPLGAVRKYTSEE